MTSYIGATRRVTGLVAVALMAAACGSGATATPTNTPLVLPTQGVVATALPAAPAATPTAAPTAAPSAPATGGVVVRTAMTSLGVVLVAPNGLTLYTRSGDSANTSSCTGGCLAAWPPLTVPAGGTASAGAGVTGTVGKFTRADNGTTQVTYKGLPLYFWKSDSKPGDVSGQGIGGFSVAKP
jgi:predicted lipoprotein with Yx(FWY)xxD motif